MLPGLGVTIPALSWVINSNSKSHCRHHLIDSVFTYSFCPQIGFLPLLCFLFITFPHINIPLYFHYSAYLNFHMCIPSEVLNEYLLPWIVDTQYSFVLICSQINKRGL